MKKITLLIGIPALLIIVALWAFSYFKQPEPKHFILIVADAMRADHLGCFGSGENHSPNIDRLAQDSIVFENTTAAGSWTFPSNCSIFTGQYPHETGDSRIPTHLVLQADSIVEYFQKAGYKTAAFSSHGIIAPNWKFDQGFDEFTFRNPFGQDERTATDAARWIKQHRDEKTFLLVYFYDPHHAYDPTKPPDSVIGKLDQVRSTVAKGFIPLEAKYRKPIIKPDAIEMNEVTPLEVEVLHELYKADIAEVDDYIGRILKAVDSDRETVIAFLSDHGEEWLEHEGLSHKELPYTEIVHVPFVLHIPGVNPQRISNPVGHLDLVPTMLDIAGIQTANTFRGQSLLPLSEIPENRIFFTESLHLSLIHI